MNRNEIFFNGRVVCCALALLGLAVLVSGCLHSMPSAASPRSHLWTELYGAGNEPPGYAMYTYVLINRSKVDKSAWSRYWALVNSITDSTSAEDSQDSEFNRSLYNLFLIPFSGEHQRTKSLNDILSKSILTGIAVSVQKQELRDLINTNPGPFLISSTEPISNEKFTKDIEILYADLTRTNVYAMQEVVAAYKRRLTSKSIGGQQRFKSIRLSLLSILLDADDYVNIVKVAYAGWIKD
jgi:hypothetical protein